jgi:transcriptional repressor NrdR
MAANRCRAREAHDVFCPFCNFEDTKVIDSRLAGEGRQVRRRRECLSCGERFTTFESPELVMPHVIKRDDRREPFDEHKLRNGILNALQKRPVQREEIERSIEHITHRLQTMGEREVQSRAIGDMVMEELRRLDEVGYVRFASVYRSFQDVTEFQREIETLKARQSQPAREQMSLLPDDGPDKKRKR